MALLEVSFRHSAPITPCCFFQAELAAVTKSESGSARLSRRHLEISTVMLWAPNRIRMVP